VLVKKIKLLIHTMHPLLNQVSDTTLFLQQKGFKAPVAGIVLGTGLSQFIKHIDIKISLPYTDIPNFPEATVEFHKGNLIFGYVDKTPVIAMQGRFHYYEGYSMQQITFPIRVMKALGVQHLLLSNAAGGMNSDFNKEDLVIISDHINLQPENPLRGLNDSAFGNRFVDMSAPYSELLSNSIESAAEAVGISIKRGVYVSVTGPNLETKAEYRYLKNIGGDMVGMSTVPEVIVANQVNIPCAAVSVITDECDPDNLQAVNIEEIIEVAGRSDEKLSKIFAAVIKNLPVS
jgi:purine-nucleoside phosphorylase